MNFSRVFGLNVLLIIGLNLSACISHPTAPVTDLSPLDRSNKQYKVKKGDTLHAISFRAGLGFQDIVAWNQLKPPYKIYVDEILHLKQPRFSQNKTKLVQQNKQKPKKQNALASAPLAKLALPQKVASWQWPSRGKLTEKFLISKARYGIQLVAPKNSAITSAASGQVVYAGNAIKGYGQLIIIKHSPSLISAYAHNNKILVKEGDQVILGQQIGRMGKTGTDEIKLHFEIRKNGEPVNPLKYLPRHLG